MKLMENEMLRSLSEVRIGNTPFYNTSFIKYMKENPNSSVVKNNNLIQGINSIQTSTDVLNKMTKEYVDYLYESGLTPTRKELKDRSNIIKSNFLGSDLSEKELDDIGKYTRSSWMHLIPCLEEAVIIDQKNYYEYSLKEIDIDNMKLSFRIRYYIFEPNNHIKFMFLGQYYFDVLFYIEEDGEASLEIQPEFSLDPVDIYSNSLRDMDIWDYDHKQFWENVVLKACYPPKGTLFSNHIMSSFLGEIGYVNYLLNKSPVKGSRRKTSSCKANTEIKEESTPVIQRIKISRRNEFGLEIVSEKKPQEPTENTVRKYKTAVWRVRGHISHSKKGKEIWIPEHTARRHNMNATNYKIPKTIIES